MQDEGVMVVNLAESQFRSWFVESMHPLRGDGNAGFIFTLTAFPLLERYLRRKCGCFDEQTLTPDFFTAVGTLFSVDGNKFWSCYRNGLLHQVSFATAKYKKNAGIWVALPQSGFSGSDPRPVHYDPVGDQFFLNPIQFYDVVIQVILADFSIYESDTTPYFRLPKVGGVVPIHGIGLTDGTGSYWPGRGEKGSGLGVWG